MDVTNQISAPAKVAARKDGIVVTGIDISITDLTTLLVKLAIAAIPAMIIVTGIGVVVFGTILGMFR